MQPHLALLGTLDIRLQSTRIQDMIWGFYVGVRNDVFGYILYTLELGTLTLSVTLGQ